MSAEEKLTTAKPKQRGDAVTKAATATGQGRAMSSTPSGVTVDAVEDCQKKKREGKDAPVVSVYGAGITGLTVAQELAERGFDVQVLEPTPSLDRDGECEIGGVARTQYSHIPPPPLEGGALRSGARIGDFALNEDGAGASALPHHSTLQARPVFGVPQIVYFRNGFNYQPNLTLFKLVENEVYQVKKPFETPNGLLPNKSKLREVARTLIDAWHVYGRCRSLECGREAEKLKTDPCADDAKCPRDCKCERTLRVDIVGHSDDTRTPAEARGEGERFARIVKRRLKRAIRGYEREKLKDPVWTLPEDYLPPDVTCTVDGKRASGWDCILCEDSEGLSRPLGSNNEINSRILNNRVEFHIREVRLPGEHGYRFYPSFYRHLDDTLSRIPVYEKGLPTRERVLANLAPVVETGVAYEDRKRAVSIMRRQVRSFEEVRLRFETLQERLGLTLSDVLLFQLKVFRYVTSCAERRSEAEDVSWWEYLEGDRYSESLQRQLRQLPYALAAVSVTDADARTTANIGVQFLLDQLGDGSRVDRTMNGPTSEAWFRHWKEYLKRQGVRFYVGHIVRIEADKNGELQPIVAGLRNRCSLPEEPPGRPAPPVPELIYPDEIVGYGSCALPWEYCDDFRVLALPADLAKKLLSDVDDDLLIDDSDPSARTLLTLKHYDVGATSGELPPHGSMRDMIGVQLYFNHDLKFVDGYNYYADSDWGLTSISQLQFWKERRARHHGYMGVLSVDVGNAHRHDISGVRAEAFHADSAAKSAQKVFDRLLDRYSAWRPALQSARELRDSPSAVRATEAARRAADQAGALVDILKRDPERFIRSIRNRREDAREKMLVELQDAFRVIVRDVDKWMKIENKEDLKKVAQEIFKVDLFGVKARPKGGKGGSTGIRRREDEGLSLDELLDLLSSLLYSKVKPSFPTPLAEVFVFGIVSFIEGLRAVIEGSLVLAFTKSDSRDTEYAPPLSGDEKDLYRQIGVQAIHAGARTFLAGMACLESKTAWNSTKRELATTVWRQIRLSIDPVLEEAIPWPSFYHVDEMMEYCREPRSGLANEHCGCGCDWLPSDNKGRYQVNLVGEFERRPGPRPIDPAEYPQHGTGDLEPVRELQLYDIVQNRWVVAGTFMKTYTRLATMEAANESARHAVNAILHRLVTADPYGTKGPGGGPLYRGAGRLMGDFCKIWNLEDYELDDLKFLKRLDARLHAEGLPHLVDILHLEDVTEQVAYNSGDPRAPLNRIPQLLEKLSRTVETDWKSTRGATDEMASIDRLLELLPKGADALNLQSLFAPLQKMWSQIEQMLLAIGSPPRRGHEPERRPRS